MSLWRIEKNLWGRVRKHELVVDGHGIAEVRPFKGPKRAVWHATMRRGLQIAKDFNDLESAMRWCERIAKNNST